MIAIPAIEPRIESHDWSFGVYFNNYDLSAAPARAFTPASARSYKDMGYDLYRFSVTQLINYQRCPRQYYFDRVLHVPTAEQMAVWNNAEAPEPPANLTATLKGAVIHRFCEIYNANDNLEDLLRRSFADVVRLRQAELADRLMEIDAEAAIAELEPLAQNYLSSAVFERIERARTVLSGPPAIAGGYPVGSNSRRPR